MAKMRPMGDGVRQHYKLATGEALDSGNFGTRTLAEVNGGKPSADAPMTTSAGDAGGGNSKDSSIAGQIAGPSTAY